MTELNEDLPETPRAGSSDAAPSNEAPSNAAPSNEAPSNAAPTDEVASGPDAAPSPVLPPESPAMDMVSVRRAPKIGRFVILGAGLGAIITFILTGLFPVDPLVGLGALIGYFLLIGVPIGAALGAIVGIIFDQWGSRRARQLTAERVRATD